jgi:hypothetical protein
MISMPLFYQTEYRLGDRGRVLRTHTGLRAFIAIAADLVSLFTFELLFGLVGLAAQLLIQAARGVWLALVAAMALAVSLVMLLFRVARRILAVAGPAASPSKRAEDRIPVSPQPHTGAGWAAKPAWPLAREV